jgi:hypothetical protein
MNIGMLWFDNDPKTDLSVKIEQAAKYYQKKYGQTPNYCMVNPGMVTKQKSESNGVKITTTPTILPNHLWIGINTASKQVQTSE